MARADGALHCSRTSQASARGARASALLLLPLLPLVLLLAGAEVARSQEAGADAGQALAPPSWQDEEESMSVNRGRQPRLPTDEDCRRLRMGLNSTGSGEYTRDPGQCWSRNEWWCFARRKLNVPSPTLLRMLRRYRRHWRKCNAEETPYQVLASLSAKKPTVCKYIMLTPMEMGLGNHALSVISAFTYALLTSRILFIEPTLNPVADLFCEPFDDTPSWILQHVHVLNGPEKHAAPPLTYVVRVNEKVDLSEPAPVVLQFHAHHRVHMQRYFCERFHRWAEGSSVLLLSSNMWWVPSLYFVPYLRTRLQLLFPTNRIFTTMAPIILHPNNRVWGGVTALLQAQQLDSVATSRPVLGIQYRDDSALTVEEGLDSVGHCMKTLFPEILNASAPAESKTVSVYLASLNAQFRGNFSGHLRKLGIEAELNSLTTDTDQKSDDQGHNEHALTEVLAISLASKTIIASPRSTFGYIMVGFSSADNWFFTKTCRKASPEPCFLIPPAYVSCSLTDNTFGEEPEHPDVWGSSTYRKGPLPTVYTDVKVGEGYRIDGMELSDSRGLLVSECLDTRWAREEGGFKMCAYGIYLHTRDPLPQGY